MYRCQFPVSRTHIIHFIIHSNVPVTTGVLCLLTVFWLSDKCCSGIVDNCSILISECSDEQYSECGRHLVRPVVVMAI